MCLAIPMRVIEVKGEEALVEIGGVKKKVIINLVKDVKTGDYLIVHAGFAIQKLDEKEALETLKLLKEMEE
ncbi:MAG: HypC/HybG/HupF family hydrogenase formation chaperone [Caldiserica bacterium]|nr:MAG: HypC/HybG/HupF family hydrogenase formation chaperone [Caldisericota bacterium]